jgi:hypothetical protein
VEARVVNCPKSWDVLVVKHGAFKSAFHCLGTVVQLVVSTEGTEAIEQDETINREVGCTNFSDVEKLRSFKIVCSMSRGVAYLRVHKTLFCCQYTTACLASSKRRAACHM